MNPMSGAAVSCQSQTSFEPTETLLSTEKHDDWLRSVSPLIAYTSSTLHLTLPLLVYDSFLQLKRLVFPELYLHKLHSNIFLNQILYYYGISFFTIWTA